MNNINPNHGKSDTPTDGEVAQKLELLRALIARTPLGNECALARDESVPQEAVDHVRYLVDNPHEIGLNLDVSEDDAEGQCTGSAKDSDWDIKFSREGSTSLIHVKKCAVNGSVGRALVEGYMATGQLGSLKLPASGLPFGLIVAHGIGTSKRLRCAGSEDGGPVTATSNQVANFSRGDNFVFECKLGDRGSMDWACRDFDTCVRLASPNYSPCKEASMATINGQHRLSVIANMHRIRRASSYSGESTGSKRGSSFGMDPCGGDSFEFDIRLDIRRTMETKPVDRPALYRVFRLMADYCSWTDIHESQSQRRRAAELLLITCANRHRDFLSSAYEAIDKAGNSVLEAGGGSAGAANGPDYLRRVAREFAEEMGRFPDFGSEAGAHPGVGPADGAATTVVVLDGLDEDAPLVRMDGYVATAGNLA